MDDHTPLWCYHTEVRLGMADNWSGNRPYSNKSLRNHQLLLNPHYFEHKIHRWILEDLELVVVMAEAEAEAPIQYVAALD